MYNLLLVDDEPLIKVAFQSAVEWGKNGFLLAAMARSDPCPAQDTSPAAPRRTERPAPRP